MHFAKNQRGFTIVELLVVIVVIAVLAAVSVNAYAGIQTRATNSQILSAVNNWEKILRMYKTLNGTMPLSDYNCLATASTDFTAGNGLAAGECMHGYPYTPAFSAVYSSTLTTDLKTILGTTLQLPSGRTPVVTGFISGTAIAAQGLRYNNLALEYYLKGSVTSCGRGQWMAGTTSDTLTQCYIDLSL